MPSGRPSSGRASPLASRASLSFAAAIASSGVLVMKQLSRSARSIASRCAFASSLAERRLARSASRASLKERCVGSDMKPFRSRRLKRRSSLDDFGHDEELIFALGRVGENVRGLAAVGHDIRALLHLHWQHGGQRLDSRNVDGVQLFDEGENRRELPAQPLDLGFLDLDAGEMRNAVDERRVDRHEGLRSRARSEKTEVERALHPAISSPFLPKNAARFFGEQALGLSGRYSIAAFGGAMRRGLQRFAPYLCNCEPWRVNQASARSTSLESRRVSAQKRGEWSRCTRCATS